ncbi:4-(cytidine 5'-diphospho)-2-C-methyl-D-erythritol kinase [Rhodoferax sp.]|uniref:4-(cytidine 5'-diphospho)-2-C-methyl-D-erythritol kinase n=1 Tax=Rhodoferax sp. TaxID=50421 RepID=UPI0008ACD879|nr:4-(cytidine 5'-diphospho)-2-C-methyl-D-erythritol kinase [Rhodoferax sp.]MDO8318149.1 4-(cytidine 5'-diphospho)-2-C-methyl-D-erythritol kinase [Rhodoferax sp.]OGB60017.1 MAG: 4-(cytidine 5'-diphospho)-2-C-methyl-D-erythritol kinase [Burkholderiales bacterium RIFOXYD12_FULL_59_19]OGB81803.1 MAG: 4-(cytidine 5'-diphospho)-2-C-methyl-D-erythritol kinase [Burkholderiales bacterium RIFOXYC12_FULL_60_6]
MKSLFDIPAPAKLNLFLHIVGRRNDGFHLLESVFMLIDWCDTLHFELRAGGAISREDLTTPLPADDLIVRAARALQGASGSTQGAHISIAKSIPEQAGLGGGSSDAATTLLALNRLWGLKLSLLQLQTIGLQLGADVPFFLSGHNAWVSGVGEQTTPITLAPARFVVVKPLAGLQTQRIFSHPDLKRDTKATTIYDFAADAYGFGHNDLQPVAQALCPAVTEALSWCRDRGLNARMTGSGSAVFARIAEDFETSNRTGFQIRPCRNLAVHPLQGWAV